MSDPPTVQLNSKVSIPDYSGLKPGTKYVGRDGKESSEIFDADDWIFLVESTFEAAGYHKANWIKNARVKLVPQTPAFTWIRVAEDFKTWEDFRVAPDAAVRYSAGIGLRLRTPVGPVRAEYAWKLEPRLDASDDKRGRWHLSLGHVF